MQRNLMGIAEALAECLRARSCRVVFAESCTGGSGFRHAGQDSRHLGILMRIGGRLPTGYETSLARSVTGHLDRSRSRQRAVVAEAMAAGVLQTRRKPIGRRPSPGISGQMLRTVKMD